MKRILVPLCVLAAVAAGEPFDDYCSRAERFGFSGAVLVARGGRILLAKGYGMADRANTVRNTDRTLFEIASATKQITAAAILKLEEQGKLSTGDSIAKHLPRVPEDCKDITVYHLLTHTSGVPRSAAGGGGADLGAAVAGYLRTKRSRKPGEAFEYWNGGYALLAGIVEQASGMSYMEYCRANLFQPAGMTHSGFTGDTHLDKEPMAVGYASDRPLRKAIGHPYGSYGWQYRGMGGSVHSVQDLYRWDRALYGDRVLKGPARAKLFKPHLSNYACGWYVTETPRKTRKIAHGGDVRGFHTYFLRFPDEDAAVIVVGNVDSVPMWPLAWNLEALLFGDKPKYPTPPKTIDLQAAVLDAVAGIYEISKGNRLVVRRDGAGVLVGAEGQGAVDLLNARFKLDRRVDRFDAEVGKAVQVTEKIGRGDVEMLRGLMLEWIPKTWPDVVKSKIWPAHEEKWGKLKSVRSLGASSAGRERVAITLALQHENGSARCKIVFQNGKLNIFDLKGPEFAASSRFLPASENRFVRFAWVGPTPPPLGVERDADGKVAAVVIQVPGTPVRAERLPD